MGPPFRPASQAATVRNVYCDQSHTITVYRLPGFEATSTIPLPGRAFRAAINGDLRTLAVAFLDEAVQGVLVRDLAMDPVGIPQQPRHRMAARACHPQESINACVVPKKPDNQPDKTIKGKYEEQPDDLNYTVRKVTPAGVVTTLAGLVGNPGSADGTGSKARFGRGYGTWARSGVAVDTAENVYVADKSNNTIRKGYPALAITSGPIQERSTDSYVRVFFWPQVRFARTKLSALLVPPVLESTLADPSRREMMWM